MELLRADSHFGAEAELAAIGEAGGCVPVDCGRIYQSKKFARVGFVCGDNRLRVLCRVAVDMRDGFIHRGDYAYRDTEPQIFFAPVFVGGGCDSAIKAASLVIATDFDSGLKQLRDDLRDEYW